MATNYEFLDLYAHPLHKPTREIIGREQEMSRVLAGLHRPELANLMLIGAAGSGKTSLVQGVMMKDVKRLYLEVDLAKMISDLTDNSQMAQRLKQLFDEAASYVKTTGQELVLFIDEFHQIMSLSRAAAEALKPLLADSGTRGIRVIAATTIEEFTEWIRPNLALMERLQRINLAPMGKKGTIHILRGMAEVYGVDNQFYDDHMFELIYDYTNRYIPSSVQPRKSVRIFDAMVGWHRYDGRKMNKKLLADVIMESENVKVDFSVDANTIKTEIDKKVFAQDFATRLLSDRLHISTASLNRADRPMGSFLFAGATGVGKTEVAKQMARLLFGEDDGRLIRLDMTEYANADTAERFRKTLTDLVWARPYSVILLDEIEKACPEVTRILLPVLDDGRLVDSNDRVIPFNNAYIIMTTNAGSEVFRTISQYQADDKGSGSLDAKFGKLIRRSITDTTQGKFPPELLGRIDCVVPFQPLSNETQKKIVKAQLKALIDKVAATHGVSMQVASNVINYLVEDNLDTQSDSGGARVVIAKFESEVVGAVAKFINTHPERKHIGVRVHGRMAFEHKQQLTSEAYIEVVALGG